MLLRLQRIKHSWGYGLTWPKSGDSRYIIMTPADQGSLTLQRFTALRYLCGPCPVTPTLGFSGQISNWGLRYGDSDRPVQYTWKILINCLACFLHKKKDWRKNLTRWSIISLDATEIVAKNGKKWLEIFKTQAL